MTQPMHSLDLDEIRSRAAHIYEYSGGGSDVEQLADVDVPALLAEVKRLAADLEQSRWCAKELEQQRDAHKAERDRLAEQVKRVRELHQPVCGGACGLDDACECEDRDLVCEECSDSCPCPTVRALDGTEAGR